MAQNYSLGNFGYNVIPKNAYTPIAVENKFSQNTQNSTNSARNLFDNMEYILSGQPTEENNIISRQMMFVGMGMKAADDNKTGRFNMMM